MPDFGEIDDDLPLPPQEPRTQKPLVPKDEEPAKPAPRPAGARQNPLIPLASLYSWAPDPADIDAALAPGRPPGQIAQGGANEPRTAGPDH